MDIATFIGQRANEVDLPLFIHVLGAMALVGAVVLTLVYSNEGLDDLPSDPNWVGIGVGVADFGLLMLIVAAVAAWLARRRGGTGVGVRVATLFIGLLLVADVVAIWAMTTKPV
jgi:hypothetical protein